MARFLIVGEGERAEELAALVRGEGHVANVVAGVERAALEHVAIVCWLAEGSPESFLQRAIDSSMRGFLYAGEAGEASSPTWTAAHNAIPMATVSADRLQAGWIEEVIRALATLGIPLKGDRLSA